ncbi:MAG: FHA domain-containing protein [Planctomycetes bacterium]|nr:FHA domain-containing protein [Planctomycetota bacterium]
MTPSSTCDVCGTVNVLLTGRCIACGQPMAAPPAPARAEPARPTRASAEHLTPPAGGPPPRSASLEDSATATTGEHGETVADAAPSAEVSPEDRTAPVEDAAVAHAHAVAAVELELPTIPVPPRPATPPEAPPRPAPAAADLDDSALRHTVDEQVFGPGRTPPAATAPGSRIPSGTLAANESPRAVRGGAPEPTYLVRLLLPEGDKRAIEVGGDPVKIGSGLDEIGLAGDPRIRAGEGTLVVTDGRLWLDVDPASTGIYRRLDGEEELADGDVVLIGEIAAAYQATPAAPALAPDAQVLGGASGSPCGRLVFLRRDGSNGPVHDLPHGKTILGRTDGHLNFPADTRLSRRHARFYAADGKVTVEDLDSRNGTYLRVRARRRLDTGDALRIGSAGVQIRSGG